MLLPVQRCQGSSFVINPAQLQKYQTQYAWSADGCLQYVTGVIRDELGGILVGYNKKHNSWQIPSGKVDAGESLETTLTRELHEEVGLQVQEASYLGTSKVIFGGIPRQGHFYATQVTGPVVAKEPETMDTFRSMRYIPVTNTLGRGLTDDELTITDVNELLTSWKMFAELYHVLHTPAYLAIMHGHTPVTPSGIDPTKRYIQNWDIETGKFVVQAG